MLILSVPYKSDDFVRNLSSTRDFDFIEYRLDYNSNPLSFPKDLINSKTIITIREDSEKDTPSQTKICIENKLKYYSEIIVKYNCFVDIEISLLDQNEVYEFITKYHKNIILSYHSFCVETDFVLLKKVIEKSNKIPTAFLKTAVVINKYSELSKLKEMNRLSTKKIISVSMGKLGKISRILYKHLDSDGTFIRLDDAPTAEGQLTLKESKLYNLKNITSKTKIGGIIGGNQVSESLGLDFYNNYLKKNNLDAAYLPFVTNEPEDLKDWILNSQINFFGFSVTMPFKEELGIWREERGEQNFSAVNLWLPVNGEFFNTDMIAFEKSFEYLVINKYDKIQVYGSGATAETALFALRKYSNVTVSGRNQAKVKLLAEKYSRQISAQNQLSNYDLFINCTPSGTTGENLFKILNLNKPIKIIDLPYSGKKTPLIENCIKEKIPFIDGKMFWKFQSEKQLAEFRKQIICR